MLARWYLLDREAILTLTLKKQANHIHESVFHMNQCSTCISIWRWLTLKLSTFYQNTHFFTNTSFLQRKYMIWYRRPLRQARLTTKLPLFNTKIPFFLANASFLQRKHAIWYRRHLRQARLTTKLLRSYFVQIKLVALLSTIQYQKFSPTRDLPTRICDNVATENGHCWYSTFFSKKF